jgi:fermentation-respiration switch protein FrsA (DUF1100 family)
MTWRLFFVPLIAIAFIALVLWWAQRRLIYFPDPLLPDPESVGLSGAKAVSFTTDDGLRLEAWFVPAGNQNGPAILFLPGNAGNRAFRAPLAKGLADRGVPILLVDYRGYGGNPGMPSEEGLLLDARAAHQYLLGRPDVDPERIVLFGESLGTGVAVRLANERPSPLILRSPFTSLAALGRHHYPFFPMFLLRDRFASLERIPFIATPLLVIAARQDRIVPAPLSERLFSASPARIKRMMVLDDVDHNDYELLAGPGVLDTIVEFTRTEAWRTRP